MYFLVHLSIKANILKELKVPKTKTHLELNVLINKRLKYPKECKST